MQYQQRKYLQLRACSFWPFHLLLQPYKLWVSLLARVFYLSEMPLSFCCSSLLPAQLLNIRYLHFATDSCRLVRVIWFLIEPINKTRVSFFIQDVPYLYILQSVINSWSITQTKRKRFVCTPLHPQILLLWLCYRFHNILKAGSNT